jgi:DNA-directed RNA polymerase specialized sigma24 family protein
MNGSDSVSPLSAASSSFNTTHWSVVLQAGKGASPQCSAALEKLCRTYWYPLYVFIRRKGYSEEDAQDLTQQFFASLLRRNDFEAVDPRKGRFRTFLLAALTHFLSNERDRAQAAKRGGGQKILSLDELNPEQRYRFESVSTLSPDKLYDLRWATTVLEEALAQLGKEFVDAGKQGQFEQFKHCLTDAPDEGAYAAMAAALGMTSQSVAVAVHRLRRRYRELVRAEVAHTVSSPMELEEEMRHLLSVLQS